MCESVSGHKQYTFRSTINPFEIHNGKFSNFIFVIGFMGNYDPEGEWFLWYVSGR
jgi:hypothetical protein